MLTLSVYVKIGLTAYIGSTCVIGLCQYSSVNGDSTESTEVVAGSVVEKLLLFVRTGLSVYVSSTEVVAFCQDRYDSVYWHY